MKALSSIIIIFCTSLFSFVASAAIEVKESSKANVFNIQYQSAQKGKVEISILNSTNEIIFKEVISNLSSFVRPYNFSSLPEGEYTVRVKDESGIQTEKVTIDFPKVVNYTNVMSVPNQENKYWLNVVNTGSEIVDVRILTATGVVLFEQSVSVDGNYNVVYDLNKVKSSAPVIFEVTNGGGHVYSATF